MIFLPFVNAQRRGSTLINLDHITALREGRNSDWTIVHAAGSEHEVQGNLEEVRDYIQSADAARFANRAKELELVQSDADS